MNAPQSSQAARQGVETAFSIIDPRASREAAWEALERGEISPDPTHGAGPDEIEFSRGANRIQRGFPFPPSPSGFR